MSLDEELSRLLSDDLPDERAAALRQRIATEPEVARAWEEMQAVADALASLPEVPGQMAPPALPDEVYDVLSEAPREAGSPRQAPWRRALPWAVAVAALFFAFLRTAPPPQPERLQLVAGESVVSGDLNLLAGDRAIELDGRARIFVEPPEGVVRDAQHTTSLEDPMATRSLLGALAGAAITITVYEGSAVVLADDGTPVTVAAGERRVFAPNDAEQSGRTGEREAPPEPGTPERAQELIDKLDALNAELDETRTALETERFAGALVRGQLQAEQGTPSKWADADVPDAMRPERFEAELARAIESAPDVVIDRVDCSEYPCIAVLEHVGGGSDDETVDWNQAVGKQVSGWTEGVLGDGHSMSMNSSRFRNDGDDARYVLFGAHSSGGDEVADRTEWRIGQLVDQIGDELKD